MATLLRRRDERDHVNDVTDDVETKRDTKNGPPPVISTDTSFEEPGSKIWLPYLELADKYDKDLVHNWRDDMDSLLIFAALFSASVTAFVIESYNSLVQDPGEVTISVLLQISQQIANGTQATAAVRPSFQPATIDVAINILWFLSLAFSLTCALAAVLVRQWARQYLRYPRSFSATSEQARARQFVFENMQWWKMDVVVDMIPALLHISLILFFIGLLLFVRAASYSLAVYLLCFSAIGGAAYSLLTIIPLIFSACPYKTPFTGFFSLCVSSGTTLSRAMWRITVVLLASLEVILLQVLSFAGRLWLPSFSIQKRERTLELSEPVRSAISRSRIYVREKRPSIQDILLVIDSIGTIIRAYFQRISKLFHERREEFHDDLTIRDAHALRWTMEYSKRDTDLFTIVSSVPEFVQLYDSRPDVYDIMRMSGVALQTLRLLPLTAGSGSERANQSAFVSCLESIVSMMPCSTLSIQRSGYVLEEVTSLITNLTRSYNNHRLAIRSKLGSVFLCTLSSLLMYWTTALEERMQASDIRETLRQSYESPFTIRWMILQCRMLLDLDVSLSSALDELFDLLLGGIPQTPCSPSEFCVELQEFRSRWVTSLLTFVVPLSLPHNAVISKSICHGATQLQHFPHSTRDSQRAVFSIMDDLFRFRDGQRGSQFQPMIETVSVYSMVLFGLHIEDYLLCHRHDLHSDFLRRVHVHRSSADRFMKSGAIVLVTHDHYTKILHNHSSVLLEGRTGGYNPANESDADAHAITQFIRCRLKDGDAEENVPFSLGAQHLTNARTILRRVDWEIYGPELEWAKLIERTAKDFGYFVQLVDDYNIEIHSELQYYEQDLVTWTIGSSAPEYLENQHRSNSNLKIGEIPSVSTLCFDILE